MPPISSYLIRMISSKVGGRNMNSVDKKCSQIHNTHYVIQANSAPKNAVPIIANQALHSDAILQLAR